VNVGDALPEFRYRITRADLVRYAGASGDFNPIHWSDRLATAAGLPGVIAHGMYTMALVGRALADWAGRPDAVVDFSVRFTRPVLVPDDDEGAIVAVSGTVRAVPEPGLVVIDASATCGGERVLGAARATVRVDGRSPAGDAVVG
jgi:acyl dehydratase